MNCTDDLKRRGSRSRSHDCVFFPTEQKKMAEVKPYRNFDSYGSETGPKVIEGKLSPINSDFKNALDYDPRTWRLLSGESQYDETVALREMIQNSVNACKHRMAIDKILGIDWSEKNAKIHFTYDSKSRILTVEDNGIGMDVAEIQNHFLTIGSSYYSDRNPVYSEEAAKFKDNNVAFDPLSHLGVGMLSCFLLTNLIEVKTRKKYLTGIDDPLSVNVNTDLKTYLIRELKPHEWPNGDEPGTIISLNLNKPVDVKRAVEQYGVYIYLGFNILVTVDGVTTTIKPHGFGTVCYQTLEVLKKFRNVFETNHKHKPLMVIKRTLKFGELLEILHKTFLN